MNTLEPTLKYFYEFGPFRLDPQERNLFKNDELTNIQPKALEILLFLIQNRGRLITRHELLETIWPDVEVEEGNISFILSILRKTLGDNPANPQYIETVPRRGYRFVAEVNEIGRRPSKGKSLAVLPFKTLDKRVDGELLPLGITYALINKLGTIESITLRSVSDKPIDPTYDPARIGRELNVDLVLGGIIISEEAASSRTLGGIMKKKTSGRIRIFTYLISTHDGVFLWVQQFDETYEDIFFIQDSISTKITEKIIEIINQE